MLARVDGYSLRSASFASRRALLRVDGVGALPCSSGELLFGLFTSRLPQRSLLGGCSRSRCVARELCTRSRYRCLAHRRERVALHLVFWLVSYMPLEINFDSGRCLAHQR